MINIKPTEKKIRIKIEPSIHIKNAHYALIFSEDSNYVKGEITWGGVITTPEDLDDVIKILGTADVNLSVRVKISKNRRWFRQATEKDMELAENIAIKHITNEGHYRDTLFVGCNKYENLQSTIAEIEANGLHADMLA